MKKKANTKTKTFSMQYKRLLEMLHSEDLQLFAFSLATILEAARLMEARHPNERINLRVEGLSPWAGQELCDAISRQVCDQWDGALVKYYDGGAPTECSPSR